MVEKKKVSKKKAVVKKTTAKKPVKNIVKKEVKKIDSKPIKRNKSVMKDGKIKINYFYYGLTLIVLVIIALLIFVPSSPDFPDQGNGPDVNAGLDDVNLEFVEAGDFVKVDYEGFLLNGEKFDSSLDRGTPLEFEAMAGRMIKGFDEGVIGMKLNEEKTIVIPPEEAYGTDTEVKDYNMKVALDEAIELTKENTGEEKTAQELVDEGLNVTNLYGDLCNMFGFDEELNEAYFVCRKEPHKLAGETLKFWIKIVEIVKKE
jgi:FKBP-type peptidyl-prolyl cis-trans isomerase 2